MWKVIVGEGESKYGPDYTWIDVHARHGLDKLASAGVHVPRSLAEKVAELQETLSPDKVAFYNRALGSFESFGLNRNGDGFARDELMRKHSTFVSNAHYFQHHQNRDPALSRGRPVASAFNDQTDMVDLIIVADREKCASQIEALESGKRVPTSMGAKVAFDVCTICDHRAKNRDEYCGHVHKLASPPYGMRQILSDGRICGVMNPDPNFFDISDVVIGAAPESETLLKVASHGGLVSSAELADLWGLTKAARDIEASILKRVPGFIGGSPIFRAGVRRISPSEVNLPTGLLGSASPVRVLRSTAALGIVLKPREFSRIMKLSAFRPPSLEEIWASEPMPKNVLGASPCSETTAKFAAFFDQRSASMPALLSRLSDLSPGEIDDGDDHRAKLAYAAYRRSLLDRDQADGYWLMKCAGTSSPMMGERSRDYLASAYLSDSGVVDKVLDRTLQISEPFHRVSGSMADEVGVEALDLLALQSFGN